MKLQKTERIKMDTIDIGLPLPMDIIASRRLAYHSSLNTSDTPNIVRCVESNNGKEDQWEKEASSLRMPQSGYTVALWG